MNSIAELTTMPIRDSWSILMTTYSTTVQNRRIEIPAPNEIADGTSVRVEVSVPEVRLGISESEWSDAENAVAEWSAWLKTIEPVKFDQPDACEEPFRRMNIDAVGRRMSESHA
jgi:hypothetical protein